MSGGENEGSVGAVRVSGTVVVDDGPAVTLPPQTEIPMTRGLPGLPGMRMPGAPVELVSDEARFTAGLAKQREGR